MTNRENALAVLEYGDWERVPVVHFGYWPATVEKWRREGHLSDGDIEGMNYNSAAEARVSRKLGFDFGWGSVVNSNARLYPAFERKVLGTMPDGGMKVLDEHGVVILQKPGIVSIPMEIDHLLKGRAEWEEHYRSRFRFDAGRIDRAGIARVKAGLVDDMPLGIECGTLYGQIRDILGVEGMSYLAVDDEELYFEIIETVGTLTYQVIEATLDASKGLVFDFGHFWEDICFKNGPLVSPKVFAEKVGPGYRKITARLAAAGVRLVSLDCDGWIDSLVPIWLENGVNVMFPIEVGTWEASIGPWREKYGKAVLGVGGMNKVVFSRDRAAVDREIERLKALVGLGGFLPCPDHRIPPDAEWDNVRYYCDSFRKAFGG